MNILVQEIEYKLNKISYETFSVEQFEEQENIEEQQNIEISAKLAQSSINENNFLFLFDVSVTGKNEDVTLRTFYLDIFYEFSYENMDEYKMLEEDEQEIVQLTIFNHYQKKIETIMDFNTRIGQPEGLTLQENIVDIEQQIKDANFDHKVLIKSINKKHKKN